VIYGLTFPDLEPENPLETVLADGEDFSPGEVFPEQHGKRRGVLRGFRQGTGQVAPPARLDEKEVFCMALPVQPDPDQPPLKLVDLVHPEGAEAAELLRHCPHVDPVHPLLRCHLHSKSLYQITYGFSTKK